MEAVIAMVTAFVLAHPTETAVGVVAAASALADITETKKDDRIIKKYGKVVVNFLALNDLVFQ